ncbi:unnamed protein product [Arabidopsis thaliana]|uniref:(thale cress) hypothetical protein n=1 Tax=Arabidopsis thaliana TaxID=3702 RepID=A0A7G2DT33_ARATH|nr:unnamed protein product [Arabidopsis thaliana]
MRDRDTDPISESKLVKWIGSHKPWSLRETMEALKRRNTAVVSQGGLCT